MKSGTNQFHGTAYDYFVNEALNAGTPFTNREAGCPAARREERLWLHHGRTGPDPESL